MSTGREIRGHGTSPSEWHAWLGARDVDGMSPPPAASRLVVVAPHPDDELLACGGLLSMHARRGGAWCIVAVTDGEASHGGGVDTEALARRRRQESEDGLSALGLATARERTVRLGLGDGTVARNEAALCSALQQFLRRGDTVVSTWRFDGHPDHEATGAATAKACAVTRCALVEAPVWMWHWATPGDERVPWSRLRRLALDVDVAARKRSALSAHASQLEARPCDPSPVLGAHILDRAAWPAEFFFVRPSSDP